HRLLVHGGGPASLRRVRLPPRVADGRSRDARPLPGAARSLHRARPRRLERPRREGLRRRRRVRARPRPRAHRGYEVTRATALDPGRVEVALRNTVVLYVVLLVALPLAVLVHYGLADGASLLANV